MADKLYVDFSKRLREGNNFKGEMYKESLEEQYENLKLSLINPDKDIKDFIEQAIEDIPQNVWFFWPSIEREMSEKNGITYLNNVVLGIEKNYYLDKVCPTNQTIIFVGDIVMMTQQKYFEVKGFQLIDQNIKRKNEIEVKALIEKNIYNTNKRYEYAKSIFTPNFIKQLVDCAKPCQDIAKVRADLKDWQEYLAFRKEWEEVNKIEYEIAASEVKKVRIISEKEYEMNESLYKSQLDEELKEIGKEYYINDESDAGETLIKLVFTRNDKKCREEEKDDKKIKWETRLTSILKDGIIVKKEGKKDDKNRDVVELEETSLTRYELIDDEEKIEKTKIEFEIKIEEAKKAIDEKYNNKIEKESKNDPKLEEARRELKILEQKLNVEKEEIKKKEGEIRKELEKKYLNDNKNNKNRNKENIDEKIKVEINKDITLIKLKEDLKSLEQEMNGKEGEIKKKESEVIKNLWNKYFNEITDEKREVENRLSEEKDEEIASIQENDRTRRVTAYFSCPESSNIKKKLNDFKRVTKNDNGTRVKRERQEKALESLSKGFFKNPYLTSYLFDYKELDNNLTELKEEDIKFSLDSLNEKQKRAVLKCLQTNSIFLLQGPPGTGKTQVITEIVSQIAKQGKKVLISSETHKAIDNVFERLPKSPEILPIRLGNKDEKENNFNADKVLTNLYKNIAASMEKRIDAVESFAGKNKYYKEKIEELKTTNKIIEKQERKNRKIKEGINNLKREINEIRLKINDKKTEKDETRKQIDDIQDRIRRLEKFIIKEEDRYANFLLKTLEKYNIKTNLENIRKISELKNQQLGDELDLIEYNEEEFKLAKRKEELSKLGTQSAKEEIRKIINKEKNIFRNVKLFELFDLNFINDNKSKLRSVIKEAKEELTREIEEIREKEQDKIKDIKLDLDKIEDAIVWYEEKEERANEELKEYNDDVIKELEKKKEKLKKDIEDLISTFQITKIWQTPEEGIEIIREKIEELAKDPNKIETKKLEAYKNIKKYLTDEIIEQDTVKYNNRLIEQANIIGVTCSAKDNFNDVDINLRKLNIDTVIIDEVSKSSFIDLLHPLLLGKKIVLVGDHKQLPPMYDLGKLKTEDFSILPDSEEKAAKNKKFTKMYETCYFEELFNNIPSNYKETLDVQYRSHKDIMETYNTFYNGQLKAGRPEKDFEHGISIVGKTGRPLITKDKNIYFVNCNGYEDKKSYSFTNKSEKESAVKLIDKIGECLKEQDRKMSLGVICTYKAQARDIKKELSKKKEIKKLFEDNDEKLIVSTVDDFQGDERDIIFVSLVRNPENRKRASLSFINNANRINVALSRARKMLVILGNSSVLEEKGIVEVDNTKRKIFKEIIETIKTKGEYIREEDLD